MPGRSPRPVVTAAVVVALAAALSISALAVAGGNGTVDAARPETTTPSASSAPTAAAADVTFRDQRYSAIDQRVLVANATLPDGGFVVLVDDEGRRRGATAYLDPGEHRDLALAIDPPACGGATLTAVVYRDDGNGRLDEGDEPYRVDGTRIDATAEAVPTLVATYAFDDQSSDGDAVTVDSARVPDGGFVVVGTTNDSLLADSAPPVVAERLGHSAYLEGGGDDIRVPLDRSPNGTIRLVAVTYADRDGDRTLDVADAPAGPLCQRIGYATANVTFTTSMPTRSPTIAAPAPPSTPTASATTGPTGSSTRTEGQSGFEAAVALVALSIVLVRHRRADDT